jgi:hypothetical protein
MGQSAELAVSRACWPEAPALQRSCMPASQCAQCAPARSTVCVLATLSQADQQLTTLQVPPAVAHVIICLYAWLHEVFSQLVRWPVATRPGLHCQTVSVAQPAHGHRTPSRQLSQDTFSCSRCFLVSVCSQPSSSEVRDSCAPCAAALLHTGDAEGWGLYHDEFQSQVSALCGCSCEPSRGTVTVSSCGSACECDQPSSSTPAG